MSNVGAMEEQCSFVKKNNYYAFLNFSWVYKCRKKSLSLHYELRVLLLKGKLPK